MEEYNLSTIDESVKAQRDFFNEGFTQSGNFRYGTIQIIKSYINEHKEELLDCFTSKEDAIKNEYLPILNSIKYRSKKLLFRKKAKNSKGVSLIDPDNYDSVFETLDLLCYSISIGNCSSVLISEGSKASGFISKMLMELFEPNYICFVHSKDKEQILSNYDLIINRKIVSQPFFKTPHNIQKYI